MNEQIINELLEQLKSSLKNVEAAQTQVKAVAGAYNAMEGQIGGFVTELGFITQNTRTMITQLEEVKKNFLANVSTELGTKIDNGIIDVKASITSTSNEIKSLTNTAISDINSSKNSVVSEISGKSQTITNAITSTEGKILTDNQATRTSLTTALSSSESRVLQQIKEKGDSIELEIGNSKDSIKSSLNFVIGVSIITLCLVIYILSKM